MRITDDVAGRERALVDLFARTFAASAGPEEGAVIGRLVSALMAVTPPGKIEAFAAEDGGTFVGGIFFTRLTFAQDARHVVLLSPVAVTPERQGRGIGQTLLRHGLDAMRGRGAEIAVTYGDPGYYSRVGFAPVSIEMVPAPLPLTQPEGWLAQSLTGGPLTPLGGPSACVAAFDDPALW